jgi:hypothetical protein
VEWRLNLNGQPAAENNLAYIRQVVRFCRSKSPALSQKPREGRGTLSVMEMVLDETGCPVLLSRCLRKRAGLFEILDENRNPIVI